MAGRLNPKQIAGSGATSGQVLAWSGSAWVPTTSAAGSARPALCFSKSYDPWSTTYSGSTTSVLVTYSLETNYQSLSPEFWKLPAAVSGAGGQLNPGIRFTWSDSSTTEFFNSDTSSALTKYRWQVRFNKDGLRISQVSFVVQNTAWSSISADLAEYIVEGNQT